MIVIGMTKPSGPRYRGASERFQNLPLPCRFSSVPGYAGSLATWYRRSQACKLRRGPLASHRVILQNALAKILLTSAVSTVVDIRNVKNSHSAFQARRANAHFHLPADREPGFTDRRLDLENRQGRLTTSAAFGFHTKPLRSPSRRHLGDISLAPSPLVAFLQLPCHSRDAAHPVTLSLRRTWLNGSRGTRRSSTLTLPEIGNQRIPASGPRPAVSDRGFQSREGTNLKLSRRRRRRPRAFYLGLCFQ